MSKRANQVKPRGLTAILAGLVLALSAFQAGAKETVLLFDVQVQQRHVYDGPYGADLPGPVLDPGYGGESFVLEYTLNSSALYSSPGFARIEGMLSSLVTPATPLDPELDAVHPGWPARDPSTQLTLEQTIDLANEPIPSHEVLLWLFAGERWLDRGILEDPTETRRWELSLRHTGARQFFPNSRHLDGYAMTGEDLLAYVERLRGEGAQFTFTQSAQHFVMLDGRDEGRARRTSIVYTGTATLRPADSATNRGELRTRLGQRRHRLAHPGTGGRR